MTKRYTRNSKDNCFHINGKTYKMLRGSREQVMNGTAFMTSRDPQGKPLTKKDFVKNKWGRIVSLKKHKTAKKEKRLEKHGYFAKKGKFGYVKKGGKSRRKSMKKGGNPTATPTPASIMGGEDITKEEFANEVQKL
tara:strand:+ start:412 stop:819 length:408 start_codon:yes stop_codon:yes gene_type:complete